MIGKRIAAAGLSLGLSLGVVHAAGAEAEISEAANHQTTTQPALTDEQLLEKLEAKKQAFESDIADGKARARVLLRVCSVFGIENENGQEVPALIPQPVVLGAGSEAVRSITIKAGIYPATGHVVYSDPVISEVPADDGSVAVHTLPRDSMDFDIIFSGASLRKTKLHVDTVGTDSPPRMVPDNYLAGSVASWGDSGVDVRAWGQNQLTRDLCEAGFQLQYDEKSQEYRTENNSSKPRTL